MRNGDFSSVITSKRTRLATTKAVARGREHHPVLAEPHRPGAGTGCDMLYGQNCHRLQADRRTVGSIQECPPAKAERPRREDSARHASLQRHALDEGRRPSNATTTSGWQSEVCPSWAPRRSGATMASPPNGYGARKIAPTEAYFMARWRGGVGKHLYPHCGDCRQYVELANGTSASIIEQPQHDPGDRERRQEHGERPSKRARAARQDFRSSRTRKYIPEGDDESDDKGDVVARHDRLSIVGAGTRRSPASSETKPRGTIVEVRTPSRLALIPCENPTPARA